jgi:hypothetical protein
MSEPTTTERHQRLQALLQDRKAKKGRASRVVHVCLDASLAADLAEADAELAMVRSTVEDAEKARAGDKRQGGKVPLDPDLQRQLKAAEAKVDAAKDAVAEATVTITVSALPADEFDELLKKHPPRDGNDDDKEFGADREAFCDALLLNGATKVTDRDGTLVDIAFAELLPELSSGERQLVRNMALEVNQRVASIPFSVAKSSSGRASSGRSRSR